jgi:hypothetical protein
MFALKEEEEGGRFVSPNLGCELASSSKLVFCFDEASSECDSNWQLGLRKDKELHIYEGGRFCKGGIFLGLGAEEEEAKFPMIFSFLFVVGDVCIYV